MKMQNKATPTAKGENVLIQFWRRIFIFKFQCTHVEEQGGGGELMMYRMQVLTIS